MGLQQIRSSIQFLASETGRRNTNLSDEYPELGTMQVYVDEATEEFRLATQYTMRGMRSNKRLKNLLAINLGIYDVFFRDGLRPWFDEFERVHSLVDEELGIVH